MPSGCEDGRRKLGTGGVEKGQFILLDAGVPHRLLVQDGVPCRMLNVEFGFARTASGQLTIKQLAQEEDTVHAFLTRSTPYLVLPDPEEVYYTMKSLVLELDQRGLMEQRLRQEQAPEQSQEQTKSELSPVHMGVIPAEERTLHREARNLTSPEQGTLVRTLLSNCSFGLQDCEARWNEVHWIRQRYI